METIIKKIGLFIILFVVITQLQAQNVSINGEMKKWHKVTLEFEGPTLSETSTPNPFTDYRLNVTFTNGSKTYVVPGYFSADGNAAESSASSGNIWKVHFAPDEIGTWTYTASFRTGSNVAIDASSTSGTAVAPIDGYTDNFYIDPTDKTGRDHRGKGRLQYVGEHYLQFAETGEYFLKGGADAPENFLAYEDFDNTPNYGNYRKSWAPHQQDWNNGDPTWKGGKGSEIIGAINYLSEKGMNVFSFLTFNEYGDDRNVFPYISQGNYKRFDCSKLDQWEIVFEHADKMGMYMHFKLQEEECDQLLDFGYLGVDRKMYLRELIARFGHHLALNWNLGEENSQTTQQQKDMMAYIHDNDPYQHNIVIHTFPGATIDQIYGQLLGDNSEMTGVSLQTAYSQVHQRTRKWVKQSALADKKWVVCNDEQAPYNIGIVHDGYTGSAEYSQDAARAQVLWGNLMAGGAGVEYYFGYDLPESDLYCQNYRSRENMWTYTRHALDFFHNHTDFFNMKNRDNLVTSSYCMANVGESYVIYTTDVEATILNITIDGNYTVKWYDPRNGGDLQIGSVTTISGIGFQSIGLPPNNPTLDWAILINREDTPVQVPVLSVAGVTSTSATLNWTAIAGAVDYTINFREEGQPWITGGLNVTSVPLTGLLIPNTTYEFRVQAVFADLSTSEFSPILPFTTDDNSTSPYCDASSNYDTYSWIAEIGFNGQLNSSSKSGLGYENHSDFTFDLYSGANSLNLVPGNSQGEYPHYWNIWIDYNADGDYDDEGELIASTSIGYIGTISGQVDIPAGITLTTGMRISMAYGVSPGPCDGFNYGEVEDYTVNIVDTEMNEFNSLKKVEFTTVELGGDEFLLASVFPNPSRETITVNLFPGEKVNSVRVINVSGQVVDEMSVGQVNRFELNLSHLDGGLYQLEMTTLGGVNYSEKVVIIK